MRKLLALAGLLLLVAGGSAYAEPYNLQQKNTGTNWYNGTVSVPVGGPIIVKMETIGTAATEFVVSHKTGNIVLVSVAQNGTIAGADTNISLNVRAAGGASTGFIPISSTVDHVVISSSGDAAGDVSTFTYDPTDANQTAAVNKGDTIAITTDGGDSGTSTDVIVTIVIE